VLIVLSIERRIPVRRRANREALDSDLGDCFSVIGPQVRILLEGIGEADLEWDHGDAVAASLLAQFSASGVRVGPGSTAPITTCQ
jgi:hypothetical protein